jgi:hypothetical protein
MPRGVASLPPSQEGRCCETLFTDRPDLSQRVQSLLDTSPVGEQWKWSCTALPIKETLGNSSFVSERTRWHFEGEPRQPAGGLLFPWAPGLFLM